MKSRNVKSILQGVLVFTACSCITQSAFATLTGSEAADELIEQMDGKYGRAHVLDHGRIVVQIGTLQPGEESTDPPVFVEDNVVGFEPENQLSSLTLLIAGANKYMDVDE